MVTRPYRKQHDELVELLGRLAPSLTAEAARDRPDGARRALSQLWGKLTIHLAMEDDVLYPRLTKCGDALAEAKARSFAEEMGPLRARFEEFLARWTELKIGDDPAGFAAETQQVIKALATRVDRENRELYPLADRVLAIGRPR